MMTAEGPPAVSDGADIDRDSLSGQIYARLRHALMTGFYEPGSRLSIRRLAAAYAVSPTPVREAVFQLVREGALDIRMGHQPRVPELTIPRYIDIRETRAPLERLATELAAARCDPDDLERLRGFHAAFAEAEAGQRWKEALVANQEFHFTIYRASGNEVLVRTIENLWLLAGPFINNQYPLVRSFGYMVHPHLQIIDALARRSPAEAGELMLRDLRDGSQMLLERLRAGPPQEPGKAGRTRRTRAETVASA